MCSLVCTVWGSNRGSFWNLATGGKVGTPTLEDRPTQIVLVVAALLRVDHQVVNQTIWPQLLPWLVFKAQQLPHDRLLTHYLAGKTGPCQKLVMMLIRKQRPKAWIILLKNSQSKKTLITHLRWLPMRAPLGNRNLSTQLENTLRRNSCRGTAWSLLLESFFGKSLKIRSLKSSTSRKPMTTDSKESRGSTSECSVGRSLPC